MVQRRAAENAIGLRVLLPVSTFSILEDRSLQDYGCRLGHEHTTDDEQQELRLEQNCHGPERTAERERAGVAHEHVGGMRVVPEEPDACAEDRRAEDRELSSVA